MCGFADHEPFVRLFVEFASLHNAYASIHGTYGYWACPKFFIKLVDVRVFVGLSNLLAPSSS